MIHAATKEEDKKKLTASCVKFSGNYGVQELFYVEEAFYDVMSDLELPETEIDRKWQMVLDHGPRKKWNKLWEGDTPLKTDRETLAEWCVALLAFRKKYAPDQDARDNVIRYLQSDEVKKPPGISCQAQADRIIMCCERANILHGIRKELDDMEIKLIVFQSFPRQWRTGYKLSGRDLLEDTIEDVVKYMNDQKGVADEDGGRKRSTDGNGSRKHDFKKRGKSFFEKREQQRKKSYDAAPCRRHNGAHTWGECPDNRRNRRNGFRGRGRGFQGGRGGFHGGRGFQGGRGGYHQQPTISNNATYFQLTRDGTFVPLARTDQSLQSYHVVVPSARSVADQPSHVSVQSSLPAASHQQGNGEAFYSNQTAIKQEECTQW